MPLLHRRPSIRARRPFQQITCPGCEIQYASVVIGRHQRACRGLTRAEARVPQGHRRCKQHPERLIPLDAKHCWLCEWRDGSFARIDELIGLGLGHVPGDKITPAMVERARGEVA